MTLQAITYTSTGVNILDGNKFTSPIQFDTYDNWFGEDLDYLIDSVMDRFFGEIEEDLLSVWSTNRSEQESADASALRSAIASAQGLTDDHVVSGDGGSGSTNSIASVTESGGIIVTSTSSSSSNPSSLDHDLSDHSGFKHKFHHPLESRYSGTASENLGGDTQGSYSRGTSGDGISVSTQSIKLKSYFNFYED